MRVVETPARAEPEHSHAPRAVILPAPPTGTVLDLIGNTPVVRLTTLTRGIDSRVLVKLESRNPGGSSKDRIALNMVREAEASGALAPGQPIVESTSGNTGIGLALVGRVTGHPVVIVHSGLVSAEKLAVLTAYGAELVEADWEAGPEDPRNPRAVAAQIAADRGAWWSSQFLNSANPGAHYRTTGPEVWQQTAGELTHFVASIGTGGTISGTGRYLKEISGGRVRIIGADPVGSTYSGNPAGIIGVDGVGTPWPASHWPTSFSPSVVDEIHVIPDERVYQTVRALAHDEGLLLGPSSGLAVSVALDVAREAPRGSTVVVVAPDGGLNYLSKYASLSGAVFGRHT
jgi:cysteine synthase